MARLSKRRFIKHGALFVPAIVGLTRKASADLIFPGPVMRTMAAGGEYSASATTFAGDNQCWLELDSTDSAADGTSGIISFWWNPGTGDSTARRVMTTNSRINFNRGGGDNSLRFSMNGTGGGAEIDLRQDTGIVASLSSTSGWSWVAAAWNNNTAGQCYVYIANAATSWVATDCSLRSGDTGGGAVIDWTDVDFSIGDDVGGASLPLNGCLSEFYLDITQYRDLTSSAIRDQFYNSSTHKPAADLTSYGSPIFYLKGTGTGFNVNSGNGGNFVKKGTTAFTSCTGP